MSNTTMNQRNVNLLSFLVSAANKKEISSEIELLNHALLLSKKYIEPKTTIEELRKVYLSPLENLLEL